MNLSGDGSVRSPVQLRRSQFAVRDRKGTIPGVMRFVGRFRFYSPFNAMLIYTQMPGAHFVCTALRWRRDYHREIKIGARPIVILQPMGPILAYRIVQ